MELFTKDELQTIANTLASLKNLEVGGFTWELSREQESILDKLEDMGIEPNE